MVTWVKGLQTIRFRATMMKMIVIRQNRSYKTEQFAPTPRL
jgi:hypothetical protein